MLTGKTVVLGVTGSIAAYKMANLASMLIKLNCDVHVLMTKNATNFINPITFETLTRNKCIVDTFDREFEFDVKHISLAQKADVFMIAPASANIIGKMANGIADDMLSTTVLAAECPKIVSPAMNTHMFDNRIVQDNMKKLEDYGFIIIPPDSGVLACRDVGRGKLPSENVLLEYILKEIQCEKDLVGKKILVTAGPTRESIDPVRYITNHSTGKMGYAIAKMAMRRGADVTLVSGPADLEPPMFMEFVPIESAEDMFREVTKRSDSCDIIIKAAAVADFTPETVSDEKIKKKEGGMTIPLKRTKDILKYLGEHKKEGQLLCGFAMETSNLVENARKKLDSKNVDMIAGNSLRDTGAGFGTDTNKITLVTRDGLTELPLISKEEVANVILDKLIEML
ncbi:MAG: bifunctional phosphopantothenoylcysteine decarboxylase/phosphopantothenate--cysteine ligase CoaBC [Firmicutes bacterium]|nr:bifunctional phosphopantothenoylcysteine decarboxylase/phosphopantothenate--cysteine ligase CoaBC [Bacillota bacterium]MBQ7241702.1 bifunctional phosphopantothenoylcysteine decarboxylase/phosphopantothenate--cysteine ligase CoaBC [Bacillota bacterium]